MLKISRLCIFILLAVVFIIYLEPLFKKIFYEKKIDPVINYSSVLKGFVIADYNDGAEKKFYDLYNNSYTRIEYQKLLPMIYYRDLSVWKSLPETIDGVDINYTELIKNRQILRLKSQELDSPKINLYPMYESDSVFTKIENPDFMFTIKNVIKFIHPETNTLDKKLSNEFTKALFDIGFDFPAQNIYGNPYTKKPFDEGYFIEDSSGKIFHLKMVKNKPFAVNTGINPYERIKYIKIQENELKSYYGVLVTETNNFYIITYDNYNLIKLPVEISDTEDMLLVLLSDLLKNVLKIKNKNQISCYVLDKNYKLIDSYSMAVSGFDEKAEKFSKIFFPLSISLSSSSSRYVHFDLSFSASGLYSSIPAAFFLLLFLKLKKLRFKNHLFDCIFVIFAGFPAFFAFFAVGGLKSSN